MNCATCACTAATTLGCALPSVVTAMPEPRSMSELPSASTMTPPPAATASIGAVCPTPAATAAALRARSSCERGPGMLVTRRRSCGSVGPPSGGAVSGVGRAHEGERRRSDAATTPALLYILDGPLYERYTLRLRRSHVDAVRRDADAACTARPGATSELRLDDEDGIDAGRSRPAGALGAQLGPRRSDALPVGGSGAADDGHAVRGRRRRPRHAYRAYVQRLAARGVVGLGFGTEVVRDGIPPALAEACRDERMPLFEVPYRTPFIAVARANAEAIAAQAYARRSWALAAQRAIALAALRPDGLGATLAELARQLDTWVGHVRRGRRARPRASGRRTRPEPPATTCAPRSDAVLRRGARAGSALRIGDTPFTLQTLGRGGHLRGVIAMAAGDLDQEGRGVVTAVIAMAGLALEQHQGLSRARGALRAGLVQSLLTGDPALARRIARDLWGPLPPAPRARGGDGCRGRTRRGRRRAARAAGRRAPRHALLRTRRRRPGDRGRRRRSRR